MTRKAVKKSGSMHVSSVFDTDIREKHLHAVKEYCEKDINE